MSTKALPVLGLAALLLGACATSAPPAASRMSEIRFGPAPAAPPALRPRVAAPAPSPVLPVTLDEAAGRVAAYLQANGFALEDRPDGPGRLLTGTRMGRPATLQGQAVCGLEAMHRPEVSSTDVDVRLQPAPGGGVQVETAARFVEIDTRLIAGALSRQTCRSRGVLEAAVRQAARG